MNIIRDKIIVNSLNLLTFILAIKHYSKPNLMINIIFKLSCSRNDL